MRLMVDPNYEPHITKWYLAACWALRLDPQVMLDRRKSKQSYDLIYRASVYTVMMHAPKAPLSYSELASAFATCHTSAMHALRTPRAKYLATALTTAIHAARAHALGIHEEDDRNTPKELDAIWTEARKFDPAAKARAKKRRPLAV